VGTERNKRLSIQTLTTESRHTRSKPSRHMSLELRPLCRLLRHGTSLRQRLTVARHAIGAHAGAREAIDPLNSLDFSLDPLVAAALPHRKVRK